MDVFSFAVSMSGRVSKFQEGIAQLKEQTKIEHLLPSATAGWRALLNAQSSQPSDR